MKKDLSKILIAGEGGQGIQTIAKILSQALVDAGYFVSYIPQFGPEQRGAPSVAFIQFSSKPINYPRFDIADLAIILRRRAIKPIISYIGRETEILFDSSTIARKLFSQNNSHIFAIPATKLAGEKYETKSQNIIVLATIAKTFFDYPKNALWQLVEKQLAKKFAKSAQLKSSTKAAFDFAYDYQLENKRFSKPEYDTSSEIIVRSNAERTAVIVPKYCKGCGICIIKCPPKCLKFGKTLGVYGTPTPDIDIEACITCGNCFTFCPDSAIRVEKKS